MKQKTSLKVILYLSIAGMLFSGYLSYTELIQESCALCGCSSLAGIPVCVYGFIMYLAVFIIALLGLRSKK